MNATIPIILLGAGALLIYAAYLDESPIAVIKSTLSNGTTVAKSTVTRNIPARGGTQVAQS